WAEFVRNKPLAPEATYLGTKEIAAPVDPGTYFVFVETDAGDVIAESGEEAESNNLSESPALLVIEQGPRPNLVVTGFDPPGAVSELKQLSLSWTVRNTGEVAAEPSWIERVRLLPADDPDADPIEIAEVVVSLGLE